MTADSPQRYPPRLWRSDAAERAEQIRLGLQQTAVLYAKAVAEKDWKALGYLSVTAWADGEFGPNRFSTERRKEIVALLTAAGYTQRQIAAATGASQSTVKRDQGAQAAESDDSRGSSGVTDNDPAGNSLDDDDERFAALLRADAAAVLDDDLDDDFGSGPPPLSPRQRAARTREAGRRDRALHALPPPPVPPSAPQAKPPPKLSDFAGRRHIGEDEIEQIIAANLTRGQIALRYGVGEHAAQLARTTAVAITRERERARMASGRIRSREILPQYEDEAGASSGQAELVAEKIAVIGRLNAQLVEQANESERLRAENERLRAANTAAVNDLHQLAGQVAEIQAGEHAANERLRAENERLGADNTRLEGYHVENERLQADLDELHAAPQAISGSALDEAAEAYLAYREAAGTASRIGTDRSKLTLFLDWLATRDRPGPG